MAVYDGYGKLQVMREAMDAALADGKRKWKQGQKEAVTALRGTGDPDGGDFLYGSITESSLDKETVVSLQHKMLHMLNVLQSADAVPTTSAREAVGRLTLRSTEVEAAWGRLK